MKRQRNLIFFLLINILVSVCATLTVLVLWDRAHSRTAVSILAPLLSLGGSSKGSVTATPSPPPPLPAATPTPAFLIHQVVDGDTFESIAVQYGVSVEQLLSSNGFSQVQALGSGEVLQIPVPIATIDSVVGVGDLELERVAIRSQMDGELSLAGWRLEDGQGNVFTFPQVTIFVKDGSVNVFSKAGANTVVDLYWGLSQPVWSSGQQATLRNAAGELMASYQIP